MLRNNLVNQIGHIVESCAGIRSIAVVSAALSKTTPAMLEGLADHLWTRHEFFIFNVTISDQDIAE